MAIIDLVRTLLPGRAAAEQDAGRRPVPVPPALSPALRLSVALQGGGSLGAFSWGVLDRLLEAGVRFDAVSGSSAGAVNAVLLASGIADGGRDAARERLARFWRQSSDAARLNFVGPMLSWSAPLMSPYHFNPLDVSPLRTLLQADVDFDRLRRSSPVRLLIGATRVRDGRLRIFREAEISAEVVMASACLPALSHAVEIEGEAYWDGGYSANPPLIPLVRTTVVPRVLVVQIVPTRCPTLPTSSAEIARRLAQINFNASLLRDLDTLAGTTDVGSQPLPTLFRALDKSAKLDLHRIAAEDHVADLAGASATDLDWRFLTGLRDAGRAAATEWLGGLGDALSGGGAVASVAGTA